VTNPWIGLDWITISNTNIWFLSRPIPLRTIISLTVTRLDDGEVVVVVLELVARRVDESRADVDAQERFPCEIEKNQNN
jgi:hypothetical protein